MKGIWEWMLRKLVYKFAMWSFFHAKALRKQRRKGLCFVLGVLVLYFFASWREMCFHK